MSRSTAISYDRLVGLLAGYGRVDLVGKSFGVVKLLGIRLQYSPPRKQNRTAPSRLSRPVR